MQQLIEFASKNPALVSVFLLLLVLLLRSYLVSAAAKNISNMEAVRLINHENAWLLDVRTQEEYQKSHIANSINIPLGLLDSKIAEIQERKANPVILVCRSGNRSSQAASALKKHTFEKIYNLSGGMLSWEQANLPVESGAKNKSGKDKQKKIRQLENKPDPENEHPIISSGSASEMEVSSELNDNATEPVEEKIVVYTSGYCPYTTRATRLLAKKGIKFQEINLDSNPDIRTEILNKSKQTTFPQIFIGDRHIGNCDELHQLEYDGKLDDILGLKHA